MRDIPEVHRSDKEIKWMKGYAHIVWFIFGRICKIQVETLPLCTTLNFVPTCMYEDLDDRGGGGWAELGEYVADAGYMHCWHSGGFVLPPVAHHFYINIQHVVVID